VKEEKRIYVVVAATVQTLPGGKGTVIQPYGRQIAQACHVVSKLRLGRGEEGFTPVTTIILQARDSNELSHVFILAVRKHLKPVPFGDENKEVYGDIKPVTAIAFYATKEQVMGVADYLPLWES